MIVWESPEDVKYETSITVKELIDVLSKIPPDLEVMGCWEGTINTIIDIEVGTKMFDENGKEYVFLSVP